MTNRIATNASRDRLLRRLALKAARTIKKGKMGRICLMPKLIPERVLVTRKTTGGSAIKII